MAKTREIYVCEQCGADSLKWQGQCPACSAWNSLKPFHTGKSAAASRPAAWVTGTATSKRIHDITDRDEPRIATGSGELDRVLGGGLVAGSVTLLGGDPGIGKSTLLLQAADQLSRHQVTLYATGEESLHQVSLRAKRLEAGVQDLNLLAETSVEAVLTETQRLHARVLVVDSIQTMYLDEVESSPGSATQVRESAARLVRFAKETGTAILIIGHVTKEGTIAGPRILEHMVDTVLYFESDAGSRYRMIRAVKNRFGAANEVGVFAMGEQGLKEVKNPSAIFLSPQGANVPGSAVLVAREGSRPMLIELQALVDQGQGMSARRLAVGLEQNRLAMLLAILHRHGRVGTGGQDVFINVVGGVRIVETSADLAVMLAITSSLKDQSLVANSVCFGEVGLAGEIRPVPYGEERLREAAKHGFKRAIVPSANAPKRSMEGMEIVAVDRLGDALERAF